MSFYQWHIGHKLELIQGTKVLITRLVKYLPCSPEAKFLDLKQNSSTETLFLNCFGIFMNLAYAIAAKKTPAMLSFLPNLKDVVQACKFGKNLQLLFNSKLWKDCHDNKMLVLHAILSYLVACFTLSIFLCFRCTGYFFHSIQLSLSMFCSLNILICLVSK